MDKSALENMRREFPDEWTQLMKEEFAICRKALDSKRLIIKSEMMKERLEKKNQVSAELE